MIRCPHRNHELLAFPVRDFPLGTETALADHKQLIDRDSQRTAIERCARKYSLRIGQQGRQNRGGSGAAPREYVVVRLDGDKFTIRRRAGDSSLRVAGARQPALCNRQVQLAKFPTTDIFAHIEVTDGRIWLKPSGVPCFAGDLTEAEQKLVYATQGAPVADLFNQKVEGTAWKTKPTWYIATTKDRTVPPDLQRFASKRMGANTIEVDSSHVPMLSHPHIVLDVIRKAAVAVQKS
jgi:pimeloyl-ACP methyl ester carboxylesterase